MTASNSSPEERMSKAGISSLSPAPRRNGHDAAAVQPRQLSTLTLSDCETLPDRGYLVKGLIAPGDLVVMHGPPGAGKSVLAPLIAHAVASGAPFWGRRVRQGPVLYIAAEDQTGMRMRFKALRLRYGHTMDLHLLGSSVIFDLEATDGLPLDAQAIIALADQMGAVLIVIDTLSRIASGWDENDNRSMRQLVDCLRALCGDRRAVLAVHHSAKAGPGNEGGSTPRGHGVLNGDADVTLRVARAGKTSISKMELGKNRNGTSSGVMAFDIVAIQLGIDEDGDPITAVVAEFAPDAGAVANDNWAQSPEHRSSGNGMTKVASLNEREALVLDIVKRISASASTSDVHVAAQAGPHTTREQLIQALVDVKWFKNNELRPPGSGHGNRRHPVTPQGQNRLTRELHNLKRKGMIALHDDLIVLTASPGVNRILMQNAG
jgi:hypothetical protein